MEKTIQAEAKPFAEMAPQAPAAPVVQRQITVQEAIPMLFNGLNQLGAIVNQINVRLSQVESHIMGTAQVEIPDQTQTDVATSEGMPEKQA